MNRLKILALFASLVAVAAGAGIVFAALGDTETASGSITVSSDSADLYICEPGVPGPDCGSDDSDDAEIVFEGPEDFLPGEYRYYDIRLKNVGDRPFVITNYEFLITEQNDPGSDCPYSALGAGHPDFYTNDSVWVLGKNGDPLNDNDTSYPFTGRELYSDSAPHERLAIAIAPADYEDVRLRLYLELYGTENCDLNEWDVSWNFIVN